jgi:hypothetical protein
LKKDYYDSIEVLPIWNWYEITQTGELKYLMKDHKYNDKKPLLKTWYSIHNEYLDGYGRSDDFNNILRLKKKWIEKTSQFVLTGDRFKLTEIDIIEADMAEIAKANNSMDKDEMVIFLEQKLGRELNLKEMSTKKWFDYIKYFSKK